MFQDAALLTAVAVMFSSVAQLRRERLAAALCGPRKSTAAIRVKYAASSPSPSSSGQTRKPAFGVRLNDGKFCYATHIRLAKIYLGTCGTGPRVSTPPAPQT